MYISEGYDTAQICKNGHLITAYAQSSPQFTKKFCQKCGEPTINICEYCKQPIQGVYHISGLGSVGHYSIPKYCYNCGKPYPWTELQIQSAKKIIDQLKEIDETEKESLKDAFENIVNETPDAKPAAYKIKTALSKIQGDAKSLLRDLIVDIASEAIVKIIMPDR